MTDKKKKNPFCNHIFNHIVTFTSTILRRIQLYNILQLTISTDHKYQMSPFSHHIQLSTQLIYPFGYLMLFPTPLKCLLQIALRCSVTPST